MGISGFTEFQNYRDLNLSLSYDVITKEHAGTIKAETKEGEFAEFIIELPNKKWQDIQLMEP